MPEPRRVVIVGTGQVIRFWVAPLRARTDVEIVGVVEPDAARAEAFVAGNGLAARCFPSVAAAVQATAADLVVNATPPEHHRAISEAALELGCDVFTEKPLAPRLEDAIALVAAAERCGRLLVVMQNRRYHPAILALRDAIGAGAIGEVVVAGADMWLAPHFPMPFVNEMAHPLLVDMAIHTFDQARFLTGRDPVSVHCVERHPAHSWFRGDALALATFELDGGALLSYRGSYVTPGFPSSFDSAWRVSGSHGTVSWDGVGAPAVEAVTGAARDGLYDPTLRRELPAPAPRDATGHAAAIDDALDALAAGRTPPTVAADNLRSLAMSFAALRSAAEGRVVELAEVLDAG